MKGNVTSLGMHSEMPSPRGQHGQSHPTKRTPGRPRKWGGREKQLASLPHSSGPPRPLPLGTASRPTDREARGALLGPSPYWREGTEHTRQYNPGAHAHPAQPKRQTTARPTRRPAARLRLPQAGRAAANTGLPCTQRTGCSDVRGWGGSLGPQRLPVPAPRRLALPQGKDTKEG